MTDTSFILIGWIGTSGVVAIYAIRIAARIRTVRAHAVLDDRTRR